ncbi:MAG TPA: hypothetical protein VHH36_03795 [Candidatus Thermoplasmatota archaeon]|nr:hypothetical protein [Candidatus Thermoplasmatota archaeon]
MPTISTVDGSRALRDEHREGERLLARRAPRAPHAHALPLVGALEDAREDDVRQRLPRGGVAEELGHRDEERPHERAALLRVARDPLRVGLQRGGAGEDAALLDAPAQRRQAVALELRARVARERGRDPAEDAVRDLARLPQRAVREPRDDGPHLGGGEDRVDRAGALRGLGHPGELGAPAALGEDGAAVEPHDERAPRPVHAGAAEDDGDDETGPGERRGGEQVVDALGPAVGRGPQRQAPLRRDA